MANRTRRIARVVAALGSSRPVGHPAEHRTGRRVGRRGRPAGPVSDLPMPLAGARRPASTRAGRRATRIYHRPMRPVSPRSRVTRRRPPHGPASWWDRGPAASRGSWQDRGDERGSASPRGFERDPWAERGPALNAPSPVPASERGPSEDRVADPAARPAPARARPPARVPASSGRPAGGGFERGAPGRGPAAERGRPPARPGTRPPGGWPRRPDDRWRPADTDAFAPPERLPRTSWCRRRPVEEALAARRPTRRLLVVPERRAALEQLVLHATALRIPVVEVEGGTLTALCGFDGHQGVALVVELRRWATIDDVLAGTFPWRATSC